LLDPPSWLIVLLVAFVPEVEARGSIPLAVFGYHMPMAQAVALSFLGNVAGVPAAWWLLPRLGRGVRAIGLGSTLDWMLNHTRRRGSRSMQRWQEVGLLLFVGVPLPGTGAWAGAVLARLFGLSWRRSVMPLVGGVAMACALVAVLVAAGQLAL
jgi:uncharacterized membrane protein